MPTLTFSLGLMIFPPPSTFRLASFSPTRNLLFSLVLPCLVFSLHASFDLADGMITAVVVLPKEGGKTFETLMKTTQGVRDYFGSNHPGFFGLTGPSEKVAREFLEQR